jgi:pimeloyl-ACP methyl ester carboxylesterase
MADRYDPRLSIEGTGDPVVLVPGLDGTGLLFYRQIPLIARAYRVASYALRDEARAMDELVADLRAVVDAVAPQEGRAIVVGESFGGALAMSFALAEPDRVSRLVVLNSFPHFDPQIRLRFALYGLRAMPWGAMGFVRRVTASRLHSRHTHREELERFMQLTARASRAGYINRLRILTEYDIRGRLAEIEAPSLFLASEQDHLVPAVAQARFMADRVPGAVVRVLAGHGHICLIAPDLDLGRILDDWRSGVGMTTAPCPPRA